MTYLPDPDLQPSSSPVETSPTDCTVAPFRVGGWRVDPPLNRVSRGEDSARLEPRVMALLVCLAERAETPISRQELLDSVCSDVVVGDEALTMAVSKLRKALADRSRSPELIETVAKRGYRLMVPVEPIPESELATEDSGAFPELADADSGIELAVATAQQGGPMRLRIREAGIRHWEKGKKYRDRRLWALVTVAALSFGWVTQAILSDRDQKNLGHRGPMTDQRITSQPGSESQGEVSPDGSRVAYVRQGRWEPNPGLYVLSLHGGFPEQLAEGRMSSPVWSPDGRRLAYLVRGAVSYEIRLISAEGGTPTTLTPVEPCPLTGIDWSP
ncbi:MAG: winged helix-turn-helix domain-containing protein, partial [Holophagales bacterium]|nr:winged helix-turn-helix domain-containing protein [Holophagales bacterium]